MEIIGRIKLIGDTIVIGANGFRKRELVVTTDEQYPQHILIEFNQDKCDVLNGYNEGQNVKVGINIKGREWVNPQGEAKYFNSIQGWRIEKNEQHNTQQKTPPPAAHDSFQPATNVDDEDDSGLPF